MEKLIEFMNWNETRVFHVLSGCLLSSTGMRSDFGEGQCSLSFNNATMDTLVKEPEH